MAEQYQDHKTLEVNDLYNLEKTIFIISEHGMLFAEYEGTVGIERGEARYY